MDMQPGGNFGANCGVTRSYLCFGSMMGMLLLSKITISAQPGLELWLMSSRGGAPQLVLQFLGQWGSRGLVRCGDMVRHARVPSPSIPEHEVSSPRLFFKRVFN